MLHQLTFSGLLLSNCLNWKIYCDEHSSLSYQPQFKYELFHIYFTSFHSTGRYELNKMTSLPMCGFIALLVEHRTAIAEVMGSTHVEGLVFSGLILSSCLNWKLTAMITPSFIYNRSTNTNYYQYTRPNRKSASSKHTLTGPEKTDSGLPMHYQPYMYS